MPTLVNSFFKIGLYIVSLDPLKLLLQSKISYRATISAAFVVSTLVIVNSSQTV